MKIPEFAEKLDNIIASYRSGGISDEEFMDSVIDVSDQVLEEKFKDVLMSDPALSEEVKKLMFPEEF